MKTAWIMIVFLTFTIGCSLKDSGSKTGSEPTSMAITSSEGGSTNELRKGSSLQINISTDLQLDPNKIYHVAVTKLVDNQPITEIAKADLLSDMLGAIPLTSVAHDIGEKDGVEEKDILQVQITDQAAKVLAKADVPVVATDEATIGHGVEVADVTAPYIYSCDSQGNPLNSFIVGAATEGTEIPAPIYVTGKGFPSGINKVDIYIMKDRSKWQGEHIPQPGEGSLGYVFGPISAAVERGLLKITRLDWRPTGNDVGPYDILADLAVSSQGGNGKFDYNAEMKDGSDGEDKVGFTIQYGAGWKRAKASTVAAQLSVDAAKNAADAANTAATKAENDAQNGGDDAKAKAQQARDAANKAQTEFDKATGASGKADAAFAKELADPSECDTQARTADQAAKTAAEYAKQAGELAQQTEAAAKAYKAAVAAAMSSKHLLVNLAYDSKSGNGTWKNVYTVNDKIFTYVNPPVQSGAKHAFVTKVVVNHQSWNSFWNNPDVIEAGGRGGNGRIKISDLTVKDANGEKQLPGGTTQHSCTNSPPVAIINPEALPLDANGGTMKFDIVFDYDNDGYYDIGVDFLDVIANKADGALKSAKDLVGVDDNQIFGFEVTK